MGQVYRAADTLFGSYCCDGPVKKGNAPPHPHINTGLWEHAVHAAELWSGVRSHFPSSACSALFRKWPQLASLFLLRLSRCWPGWGTTSATRSAPSATSTTCAPAGSWRATTRRRSAAGRRRRRGRPCCWTSWRRTPAAWTRSSTPYGSCARRTSSSPRSRTRCKWPRTRRSTPSEVCWRAKTPVESHDGLFTLLFSHRNSCMQLATREQPEHPDHHHRPPVHVLKQLDPAVPPGRRAKSFHLWHNELAQFAVHAERRRLAISGWTRQRRSLLQQPPEARRPRSSSAAWRGAWLALQHGRGSAGMHQHRRGLKLPAPAVALAHPNITEKHLLTTGQFSLSRAFRDAIGSYCTSPDILVLVSGHL